MTGTPASPSARPRLATSVLMWLVRGYQRIPRPMTAVPRCRFQPTCSSYALVALQEHGAGRGLWLTARRLARCHPFHPGGIDAVPAAPVARDR